jgi:hypothetical protein
VDPVPDPLHFRNLVAPGKEPWTFGSVTRNSAHYTTDVVSCRNIGNNGKMNDTKVYRSLIGRYLLKQPLASMGDGRIILKWKLRKQGA